MVRGGDWIFYGTREGRSFTDPGAIAATLLLNITSDSGKFYTYELKGGSVTRNDKLYYAPDDRVLKMRAMKYPVKCPIDPNERIVCPKCGSEMKAGRRYCPLCRTNFEEKRKRV